jgi:branched-chain amino acid transport system substrate-binding protein
LKGTKAFCGAAALVLSLCLGACGGVASSSSSPAAHPSGPYDVVLFGGLTSGNSAIVNAQVLGLKAAASVLNKQGGTLGRMVKLEVFDDGGDPTKAVSLYQQRIAQSPRPDLIIAGESSSETLALLPLTTQAGFLTMDTSADAAIDAPATYPYNFGVSFSTFEQGQALADYVKTTTYKKIGLLVDNTAFGQGSLTALNQLLPQAGVTVTSETMNSGTVDVTPELGRLQAANPDVLMLAGINGADMGYVFKSLVKLGWKTPIIGDTGLSYTPLAPLGIPASAYSNAVSEVQGSAIYVPTDQQSQNFKNFLTAEMAQGPIALPAYLYSESYDILMLAAAAATQAKSTDPKAMTAALEGFTATTQTQTVNGPYVFSKTDHFPAYVANQTFKFIKYTGTTIDGLFVPGT